MITTATKRGPRSYQEDRFVVVEHGEGVLLAVADGHGGVDVAKYVANHLKKTWECVLRRHGAKVPAVRAAGIVMQCVRNIRARTCTRKPNILDAGSTLSIAYIPARQRDRLHRDPRGFARHRAETEWRIAHQPQNTTCERTPRSARQQGAWSTDLRRLHERPLRWAGDSDDAGAWRHRTGQHHQSPT